MTRKILVLGSSGMAGHLVHFYFHERGWDTLGVSRSPCDIDGELKSVYFDVADTTRLKKIIIEGQFDCVANCIGVLNKDAEINPHKAIFLNSYLPHWLSFTTKTMQTKVVHLSTDCVFSGSRGNYTEYDEKDGATLYDRTKALGELNNDKDLTFRQSIIGPEIRSNGIGLLHWFLNQSGEVRGFKKAIWNGITTLELAKGIEAALLANLTGLYHLVSPEVVSKYVLLHKFQEHFGKKDTTIRCDESAMNVNKTLVNTRTDFKHKVPDYETMLSELSSWMKKHKSIYKHYGLNN